MLVRYSSNNSGGDFWLSDDDWLKLEKAGWKVEWEGGKDSEKRFLGARARSATTEASSVQDAIDEFEQITGQNADDEGCGCCGQPHNFYQEVA